MKDFILMKKIIGFDSKLEKVIVNNECKNIMVTGNEGSGITNYLFNLIHDNSNNKDVLIIDNEDHMGNYFTFCNIGDYNIEHINYITVHSFIDKDNNLKSDEFKNEIRKISEKIKSNKDSREIFYINMFFPNKSTKDTNNYLWNMIACNMIADLCSVENDLNLAIGLLNTELDCQKDDNNAKCLLSSCKDSGIDTYSSLELFKLEEYIKNNEKIYQYDVSILLRIVNNKVLEFYIDKIRQANKRSDFLKKQDVIPYLRRNAPGKGLAIIKDEYTTEVFTYIKTKDTFPQKRPWLSCFFKYFPTSIQMKILSNLEKDIFILQEDIQNTTARTKKQLYNEKEKLNKLNILFVSLYRLDNNQNIKEFLDEILAELYFLNNNHKMLNTLLKF